MNSDDTIRELPALSRFLGEEHRKLAILGEGNTLAKIDDETLVVKASASRLQTLGGPVFMSDADVVRIDSRADEQYRQRALKR